MEKYIDECLREVGLPLDNDWINNEVKRLYNESAIENKCILCSLETGNEIPLPDFPCGLMKSQALINKKKLEKNLHKKAINLAYKKFYNLHPKN